MNTPTGKDSRGFFSLVLHAHLPFVRDPDHERFLEENWFYEAVLETYLPLLALFDGMVRDRVDFRITLNLTPTLLAMFDDELLRDRCERRLGSIVELCEKELVRHRHDPAFLATAGFYLERFRGLRDAYVGSWGRDITGAFRKLQDRGFLEILACAATHAYLPLIRHEPAGVRAQVKVGADAYRRAFGRDPRGFWLPECAYYEGLDLVLAEEGIRYFLVESHGVLHASTRARYGVHAPIVCPSGVAAFARDPECTRQVWSADEGFPGHPDYREFHRDIGFELPLDVVGPYIGADGLRTQTGLKYHRVTVPPRERRDGPKEPYDRNRALERADEHAALFLEWREAQVAWLSSRMDREPIIVAPYDAELFGHWWFEGPEWIHYLMRRMAGGQGRVRPATPSEYLEVYPENQAGTPSDSSWGYRGFNEVWLNGTNDWIYPPLLDGAGRLSRLAFRHRGAGGELRRVLDQASRELLLAQASDWAFILKDGTATRYAADRVRTHLANLEVLLAAAETPPGSPPAPRIEEEVLRRMEARSPIFPDLSSEVFAARLPRPRFAIPEEPRHVVFLTAEAAPFIKVGGLADVAGALPPALARLGVRVTVILPAYRALDRARHRVRALREGPALPAGDGPRNWRILEAGGADSEPPRDEAVPRVRVLFIEEPGYFDRAGVYVDPATGHEYPDSSERFAFFTRAALEALRLERDPVDILHVHDHQTAIACALRRLLFADDPALGLAGTVYTLHNLGYQGESRPEVLALAGLDPALGSAGGPFDHGGRVNFMKAGIRYADKVNTVSEGYAREILEDPAIGAGLGDALRARGGDFSGILNGIDTTEWDPGRDPHLPVAYGPDSLEGKRKVKVALLDRFGLVPELLDRPVLGMVTRLVDQKGLDLVVAALPRILELGAGLVILGTGIPRYEAWAREAALLHPGRVAARVQFDNALAHLIEGGADMFLMPSLYEPCGLNQMYSLRYGTVPIVRATGGLADTVSDADRAGDGGVGFSFRPMDADYLVDAIERAVRAYTDPERWRRIVLAGMARDNSWEASATRYLELYREALRSRS